ncbi:hypothetical protein DFH07DRAFT_734157, partial [Mycena maculata]
SDPRAGTPSSVLTTDTLLTMISLYYMTQTFQSSVWIYTQNPTFGSSDYIKPLTNAQMLFSLFEFDLMFWSREYVQRVGNLVLYKGMDRHGHFAGSDNPLSARVYANWDCISESSVQKLGPLRYPSRV